MWLASSLEPADSLHLENKVNSSDIWSKSLLLSPVDTDDAHICFFALTCVPSDENRLSPSRVKHDVHEQRGYRGQSVRVQAGHAEHVAGTR